MSWLLAACVPGLLMLATFGLQRLEAGITDDSVESAKQLTKLIDAAAPRPELPQRAISRRSDHDFPVVPPLRTAFRTVRGTIDGEPGLPTRRFAHANANPEFRETPHANRV
ncbi:hypothetical protein H7J73_30985 [Mycolicibacterium komossense]|uniref:Two-component sensor histidine kinase n=1 Tax=Mycolicibacterium komossense TaxID=1779 RepID=A0ABT3CM23_9MYCO|nr:hypothetical protein [Mycolicibacterium komossense]MCV7230442.1 hypothetical protein [Mycolicibacterium komossense]